MRSRSSEPDFTDIPLRCTSIRHSFSDLRQRPCPRNTSPFEPAPEQPVNPNQLNSIPPFFSILTIIGTIIRERLCSFTRDLFLYLQKYKLVSLVIFPYLLIFSVVYCFILSLVFLAPLTKPKDDFELHQNYTLNLTYLVIATLTTVGYGDVAPFHIIPDTIGYKLGSCFLIILVVFLFNYGVSLIVSRTLSFLKFRKEVKWIFILEIFSFTTGFMGIYFTEKLGVVNSLYLTVVSIATIGYGDISFISMHGKVFACAWLVVATMPWNAFLVVVQMKITKYFKKNAGQSNLTIDDPLFVDMDCEKLIRKFCHILNNLKDLNMITIEQVRECAIEFDEQEPSIPLDLEWGGVNRQAETSHAGAEREPQRLDDST